jgi:hypothetical protein
MIDNMLTVSCKVWKFYEDYSKEKNKNYRIQTFLSKYPYIENIANSVAFTLCDRLKRELGLEPEDLRVYEIKLRECFVKNEYNQENMLKPNWEICLKETYPTWFLVEPLKYMNINPYKIEYLGVDLPEFLYLKIILSPIYHNNQLGRPKTPGIIEISEPKGKISVDTFVY